MKLLYSLFQNKKKKSVIKSLLMMMMLVTLIIPMFSGAVISYGAEGEDGAAAPEEGFKTELFDNKHSAYLYDEADLFKTNEEDDLYKQSVELVKKHDLDVAILTLKSLPEDAKKDDNALREYTKKVYKDIGLNDKGILMLVAYDGKVMRRRWFLPGEGIVDAFTASGQEYMWRTVKPLFSDLKFYEGYKEFLTKADDFIIQYKNGKPYDKSNHNIPKTSTEWLIIIGCALAFGLLIAFFVVYCHLYKGQLKSVKSVNTAANYERAGSRNVTLQNDFFLYSTVSRSKRSDNDSSSSGSSSGSGGSGGDF